MAKILVVEDDESVCSLLETNLLIKGHEVLPARTGADCIEMLDKDPPDFIVLDIMLPDTDGFELLEHIRSKSETEHIPVLILTARGDERDRVRGFAAGADDYLVKPFFSTELLLRIDRLLNTSATGSNLRKLALTDQVTGLGNRSYFGTRLEQLTVQADRENLDLTLFVVDLPGLPEQVRKTGWRTADMALAKLGSAVREALKEGEEAFWLGTQCVVTSLEIDSGAKARSRLDDLKSAVKEALEGVRRQIPLIPYFGYTFFEPPETTSDLLDKITKAPYGTSSPESPKRSQHKSGEASVEAAFGGKLTGLAPVDYTPEQSSRRHRTSGEQKIDRRAAMSQMRQIAASLDMAARTAAEDSESKAAKRDSGPLSAEFKRGTSPAERRRSGPQTVSTQPISTEQTQGAELPELGDPQVAAAIGEMLDEASRAPFDIAVCCLNFDGAEQAKERLGKESVASILRGVASQTAAESALDRHPGSQAFWTGDNLFVVVPSASVADARALCQSLTEIASTKLTPHRLDLKVSVAAGYVFFDFEEGAADLIERAKQAPYKGGVLVTPLQARMRSESTKD
jgi:PleD family two-component response regulator